MTKLLSNKMLLTFALLATLSIASLPNIAHADTTDGEWVPANRSLTHVGEKFTKVREDLIGTNELIFTSGKDTHGLLFVCANRKLRAAITTRPQSWESVLKKSSRRGKSRTVKMSLGGGDAINLGDFTYKPVSQYLSGQNGVQAAKLYNAVVKGKTINIDIGSKGNFDITPPTPNSAFADFGERCGIGRHK